jgi:hypothetical protein
MQAIHIYTGIKDRTIRCGFSDIKSSITSSVITSKDNEWLMSELYPVTYASITMPIRVKAQTRYFQACLDKL